MIVKGEFLQTTPCKKVSIFEGEQIIKKLEDELSKSAIPGIGLAAPQIGIDADVFIIRLGEEKIDFVNPVIKDQEDLREFYNEGCLSFENERIITKRYNEIYIIDDLRPAGYMLTGLWAVVAQHESGHTLGKTMYNYEIKIPRPNDKCWCGEKDKKYKKCHYGKTI